MELVEIDLFDTQSTQRRLALASNRVRRQNTLYVVAILPIPDETALGKHVRAAATAAPAQKSFDDFLGMTVSVDGSGIDPVDAVIERLAHRRQRRFVVLWSPLATSRRPGSEPDTGNVHVSGAKLALWER